MDGHDSEFVISPWAPVLNQQPKCKQKFIWNSYAVVLNFVLMKNLKGR